MENYEKFSEEQHACEPPFPNNFICNAKIMSLKENSKFKNILQYAGDVLKVYFLFLLVFLFMFLINLYFLVQISTQLIFYFLKEEHNRNIIFQGSGEAISKCISCVELFKRNFRVICFIFGSTNVFPLYNFDIQDKTFYKI